MLRRSAFLACLLVVVALCMPGLASASAGTCGESRIGGIDLVAPALVGIGASSSPEHQQGIEVFGYEDASRATHAARGTQGVGAWPAGKEFFNTNWKSVPTGNTTSPDTGRGRAPPGAWSGGPQERGKPKGNG